MTNTRLVRFPHGVWAAVAALPMGSSVYVVQEIVDERPFRIEALRRIAPSLGPVVNRPGVALAGSPGRAMVENAVKHANAAADVLTSQAVRNHLMQKLGEKLRNTAGIVEHVYRTRLAGTVALGSMDASSKLHVAVGDILARVRMNDPTAVSSLIEMAHRQNFDKRAATFLREVVMHARASKFAQAYAGLFAANGFGGIAAAIANQRQQVAGPSR